MTTIGQLIEVLYAKYERQLHDHELARAHLEVKADLPLDLACIGSRVQEDPEAMHPAEDGAHGG
jgi:hypothetical protein